MAEIIPMQRCRKCRLLKGLAPENFARHPQNVGGWRAVCVACNGRPTGRPRKTSESPSAARKRCSKCEELLGINDDNFRFRVESSKGWTSECRRCEAAARKARHETKNGHPAHQPAPRLVGNSAERSEAFELRLAVDAIRPLILAYEAVRTMPGHARNRAESDLALALSRHGSWVACDGRIYRWVREEQSISRMPGVARQRPRPVLVNETLA